MSQHNRYASFDISTNATVFEFTSSGPKGEIKKIIQFTETRANNIFNLAFGNVNEDGSIDDVTTNDNKDRDKILATVATTVYDFSKRYPERYVFFTGSSKERTRLYRMALTINQNELAETFDIWGLREEGSFEPFEKRRNYNGFFDKKKIKRNFTTVKQAKKNTTTKKSYGIQVRVKKRLDTYADKILFPEKLAKANKLLKGVKIP